VATWEKELIAKGYKPRTAREARKLLSAIMGDAIPRYIQINTAAPETRERKERAAPHRRSRESRESVADPAVATNGFEDLQLYREMSRSADERFFREEVADGALREKTANVLRSWASAFPGSVEPKY
jgi:hypothetical protein